MRKIGRFAIILSSILICSAALTGCGGQETSGSPVSTESESSTPESSSPEPDSPPAEDNSSPELQNATKLSNYLGSLYQSFEWSGAVRDPMREELEIRNANDYVALTETDKATLFSTAMDRAIIAQIGGMGSAKIAPNADQPSDQFSRYMDALIIDGGAQWRSVVKNRAEEVSLTLPEGAVFYWQIGNEINASSYTRNAVLYFDNETGGLSNEAFELKVYVEYFLAPTLQALAEAEVTTNAKIKAALGSVSAFSAPDSQVFLNDLLNYTIEGTFASALSGRRVYEVIDLITIQYLGHSFNDANPEHWRETLTMLHNTWLHEGIDGVWITEEVGINLAQGGLGAGSAIAIAGRYLQWVFDNQLTPLQAQWFYYGTSAGPEGQRISDAMSDIYRLTGGQPVTLAHTDISPEGVESRVFIVTDEPAALLQISAFADQEVSLDTPVIDGDRYSELVIEHNIQGQIEEATLYTRHGTSPITVPVEHGNSRLIIDLSAVALTRLESILVKMY